MDGQIQAIENKVLIRRTPLIKREGIVSLSSGAQYRDCIGEVLSIGDTCDLAVIGKPVAPGDRILYDPKGVIEFQFGDDPDLALIWDAAVLVRIEAA